MREYVGSVRPPAVAGRFYPGDPHLLRTAVNELFGATPAVQVEPAVMAVAPHAGYMYSGEIAAATYARVAVPRRVIILCPNHTGMGRRRSLWSGGSWRLPDADVPVDAELVAAIRSVADVDEDREAHLREHAIEVHLPLLLSRQPGLRFAPLCLAGLTYSECRQLARGIAEAVRNTGDDVLLVASTDMSHYVSAEEARQLDHLALDPLVRLDPEGLYRVVREKQISMCGYIPTTVALLAALELGARRAELVRYGNSGEVSGDFHRVVGYAGVVVR